MARSITDRQAKAIAHSLADEIETRAQHLIDKGLPRDKAIMLTIARMSGHVIIAKG